MDVSPSIVLAIWSAGVGGASALVARWRIVGPGFTWLAAGVTLALAIPAALAGASVWAWSGCVLAALTILAARRWALVVLLAGLAAVCLGVGALVEGGGVEVVTGVVALGGVTGEMMLGHWYLVDPRLPRRALRTLDAIGTVGVAADVALLVALGAIPWSGGDAVLGWSFVLLAATSLVLMGAVWFSLAETGYSGVMAATGLSYLAVLTTIGCIVAGRILVG